MGKNLLTLTPECTIRPKLRETFFIHCKKMGELPKKRGVDKSPTCVIYKIGILGKNDKKRLSINISNIFTIQWR